MSGLIFNEVVRTSKGSNRALANFELIKQNSPSSLIPTTQEEVSEEQDLIETFIQFLDLDAGDGRVSPDTVKTYRTQIGKFFAYCQGQDLNPLMLSTSDIKAYRKSLIDQEYAEATIRLKLKAVKRFYDACLANDLVESNPAADVKSPVVHNNQNLESFLNIEDLKLLFSKANSTRDLLILQLLSLQSFRTIEVHQLNRDSIVWQGEDCYMTVSSKRGQRTLNLHPQAEETLQKYLRKRRAARGEQALIVSSGGRTPGRRLTRKGISNVVNRCLVEAGLKHKVSLDGGLINFSNHSLRHAGASVIYEVTHDPVLVQQYLGHNDSRSTSRYIHRLEGVNAAKLIEI